MLLEAALTVFGIVGGYALSAVLILLVTPKQESLPDRIASAALALFAFFVLCVVAFVGTEALMENYKHESNVPMWLDAWNKASENMLSEVFQVWLAALYFKHRRWPGSPEE